MKTSDYVKGLAMGTAAITARMIAENMAQRTVGKALSKITIPAFIISYLVMGGYFVSQQIDPEKGADKFTYALLNPERAAVQTGTILLNEFGEHIPKQTATPIQPLGSLDQRLRFVDNAVFALRMIGRY